MSNRYCPSCYSATEYKIKLPETCSKCGKSFTTVFEKEKPKVVIDSDFNREKFAEQIRKETIKAIYEQQKKGGILAENNYEFNEADLEIESSHVDSERAQIKASQYKRKLQGFTLNLSVDKKSKDPVKIKDLLDNPDKYGELGQR